MHVNVTINLTDEDAIPTATPADVLIALGGDPEKDSIGVSISAGHAPPPPPPPELPEGPSVTDPSPEA